MITSFMDNLRKPKKLGRWAPTGEIRAGESDPYNWAKDLIERDRRDEMAGEDLVLMRRGNMGRVGARMSNPDWNDTTTNSGLRQMDVVYDQRPEMFQKQLNFQKDQAAQAQKNLEVKRLADSLAANDDFIQTRRENEMKSRGMDNDMEMAKQKLAMQIGDREKLEIENAARLAQIQAQGGNAKEVAELNNTRAREIAEENNRRAAEVAAGNNKATVTAAEIRSGNRGTDPKDVAQTTQNKLAQLFLDPEFAQAVEQKPDGGFAIVDGIDDDLRRRLSNRLYARTTDINLGGIGSAALGGSPSSPGLRGNAPIDANATATPYAKNSSNSAPIAGGGGQVMRKTQKSAKTGAVRTVISRDGGKTWQPE